MENVSIFLIETRHRSNDGGGKEAVWTRNSNHMTAMFHDHQKEKLFFFFVFCSRKWKISKSKQKNFQSIFNWKIFHWKSCCANNSCGALKSSTQFTTSINPGLSSIIEYFNSSVTNWNFHADRYFVLNKYSFSKEVRKIHQSFYDAAGNEIQIIMK